MARRIGAAPPTVNVPASRRAQAAREAADRAREEGLAPDVVADAEARAAAESDASGSGLAKLLLFGAAIYFIAEEL